MKNAALRAVMPVEARREVGDDFEYAERSNYWLEQSKERPKNYRRKRRDRTPVILAGQGVSLRIDRGTLFIRDGFTHYPQERREYRFFRGDLNLPSRILMLDGSGSISFDVLGWLGEQKIPLIQINWRGEVITVASESGHSADPKMVAAQVAALKDGSAQKAIRELIIQKLRNSIETVRQCAPQSPAADAAIAHIEKQVARLSGKSKHAGNALLGIEGGSAALYFQAFHGMPIKWKGVGRKPVPSDWYQVGPRICPFTNSNWQARHPINAMLNYAYAVLYGQVRTQIIATGLDPNIGLMHSHARKKRENLPLDLMEPQRPIVDRIVLAMVQDETFLPADFIITAQGVCRLHPQMCRLLAKRTSALSIEKINSVARGRHH